VISLRNECGYSLAPLPKGFLVTIKLPCETEHRASTRVTRARRFGAPVMLLMLLVWQWHPASAQQQPDSVPVSPTSLTVEQVVHNLVQMNLQRVQALHAYEGARTYRIEYKGFPGDRSAEMGVKVKCLSPGKRDFVIQSTSGSKLIIDRVLKKLLEAEEEQLDPEIQRRSALNEDNYRFTLIGFENTAAGSRYMLSVEPRRKDKFLYRGRIWVDAGDFAVVRVEAEPAKNPSLWIKQTDIVQVYAKVNDFWLPAYNHSASAVRLGGHADLTIEYKAYEITNASQVSGLPPSRSTLHAETAARTQPVVHIAQTKARE
jgi:hypothetical protein